jgi:hypothetical protein
VYPNTSLHVAFPIRPLPILLHPGRWINKSSQASMTLTTVRTVVTLRQRRTLVIERWSTALVTVRVVYLLTEGVAVSITVSGLDRIQSRTKKLSVMCWLWHEDDLPYKHSNEHRHLEDIGTICMRWPSWMRLAKGWEWRKWVDGPFYFSSLSDMSIGGLDRVRG